MVTLHKDLHISAMVQISKLSANINLLELATNLSINDKILYIEFGSHILKGHNPKNKPKKKEKKAKKYFYNQATIHVHNATKINGRINVKIFNNGRVQMTGINNEYQGLETLQIITENFNKIAI